MRHWLYTNHGVSGPPQELRDTLLRDVTTLLGASAGTPPAADGSIPVVIQSALAGVELHATVLVTTGVAFDENGLLVIPLEWTPQHARMVLPAFEGRLELEQLSADYSQLAIAGSYRIPLGVVGKMADSTALLHVAERTADALVVQVAHGLEHAVVNPRAIPRQRIPSPQLTVADVMTRDPIVLSDSLDLRSAAQLLVVKGIGGAPVVSASGELVGVLSERDLVVTESSIGATQAHERTVGELASRPAITCRPDSPLRAVAWLMVDRQIGRLVVVAESRIVGIVTRRDVLTALLRRDDDLQAAVETVLLTLDEPDITATAEWGVVTLAGRTSYRSRLPIIVDAVSAIDGVSAVETDLTWDLDDRHLVPPSV